MKNYYSRDNNNDNGDSAATTTTYKKQKQQRRKRHHVIVIVLGDLGRSPRMQYHTLSLLKNGHYVTFIGYNGTELIPDLVVSVEECRDDNNSENNENNENNESNNENDNNDNTNDKKNYLNRLNVIRFSIPTPTFLRKYALPVFYIWRISSLCIYLIYILFVRVQSSSSSYKSKKSPRRQQQQQLRQNRKLKPKHNVVDCVLVQNPPAIPLLFIVYVYCRLRSILYFQKQPPKFIIDWHNLGYSMISNRYISSMAKLYERYIGPLANGHLCVTKSMKSYLQSPTFRIGNDNNSNINVNVLYDCPPNMFQPLSCKGQHELLVKLHNKICENCPKHWYEHLVVLNDSNTITNTNRSSTTTTNNTNNSNIVQQTLFTEQRRTSKESSSGKSNESTFYQPRCNRPALIISSTSWTPDEDFNQLLDALIILDQTILKENSSNNLKVVVVVTGKGPLKLHYEEKISKLVLL